MAITLDELLGRNTTRESTGSVDSFPSYNEYTSTRRNAQPAAPEYVVPEYKDFVASYDFDSPRSFSEPRSNESARRYEESRVYEMPRMSEYRGAENAYMSSSVAMRSAQADTYEEVKRPTYGYSNYETYAKPQYQTAEKRMSLYEFTANDHDRLSDRELMTKLSHAAPSMNERVVMPVGTSSAQPAQRVRYAPSEEDNRAIFKSETKKRARLNKKGKILLAVYIAVILVVAVLIIVNAGSINSGKATVPSSSVAYSQTVESAPVFQAGSYNHDSAQINFVYEKGI